MKYKTGKLKKGFVFTFNVMGHDALTLRTGDIGQHKDGWLVAGDIHEDYYEWVNEFEALHKKYGRIYGDFESKVYAETITAFEHFIKNHEPEEWDYWDI